MSGRRRLKVLTGRRCPPGEYHVCKQALYLLTLALCAAAPARGEVGGVSAVETVRAGLGANDLADIEWDGESIWVSGSGTLTTHLWGSGRSVTDWLSYSGETGFGRGSMTALHARNDTLIVAWRYNDEVNGEMSLLGDGLSISTDRGATWRHIPVVQMFLDRAGLNYPGNYTITYDIEVVNRTIWAATTSGFLLKSTNLGQTWTDILPDGGPLDLLNNNHHGQCVDVYGDTLWVGTFQGMNLSTDGGDTWVNFSYATDGGDGPVMPGNFCVAVDHNVAGGKTHVWVGSQPYYGLGTYGIAHTDDNGATWEYATTNYSAWNFAFGHPDPDHPQVSDRTVYAATDSGLVVTNDLGETWSVLTVVEDEDLRWTADTQVFGVLVVGDSLWVTGSDGLALSEDWGTTWSIFRGVTRVKTLDKGDTTVGIAGSFDDVEAYAFPNPFTPRRSNRDYGRTRINYALTGDARVNVAIHDFAGRIIREIIEDEFRAGGRDYQEVWDGRDADGVIVPNGTYFYTITTGRGDSASGKIVVLD